MVDLIPQGGLVDSTDNQSDERKRLKHIKRPDLYRLLRDLGFKVTPAMAVSQLRMIVLSQNVNVWEFIDWELLRYNPKSEAVKKANINIKKRREVGTGVAYDDQPGTGGMVNETEAAPSIVHDDVPFITPEVPKPAFDYNELTINALQKRCEAANIPWSRSDRKGELVAKLNGQDTS